MQRLILVFLLFLTGCSHGTANKSILTPSRQVTAAVIEDGEDRPDKQAQTETLPPAPLEPTQTSEVSGPLATALAMKSQAALVTSEPKEVPEAWLTWLKAHLHPLSGLPAADHEDLQVLKELVGDARIVQLGESAHLIPEYEAANLRIIKFLHEEMGFNLVGIEFPIFPVYYGYREYLRQSDPSAEPFAYGSLRLQALFEYAKSTEKSDNPLRIVGLDVYYPPFLATILEHPNFLKEVVSQVDTVYAEEVYKLDAQGVAFIMEHRDEIAATYDYPSVAADLGTKGEEWIQGYQDLIQFLDEHMVELQAAYSDRPETPFMARQTAFAIQQDLRKYYASQISRSASTEVLDIAAAENAAYFLEQAFPGSRMITWFHNGHIMEAGFDGGYKNFGQCMAEMYENNLYTIGLFAGSIPRNEIIWLFHLAGEPVFLIDLLHQTEEPGTEWMFGSPYRAPIERPYRGLRNSYDAILYIDKISLPVVP